MKNKQQPIKGINLDLLKKKLQDAEDDENDYPSSSLILKLVRGIKPHAKQRER